MIKNYIKIIIAGAAGTIATKLMGYGGYTLPGFSTFIFVFMLVSLVWHLLEGRLKFKINLKKTAAGVVVFFTLLTSSLYFILWQYQNSTPYTNVILDENRALNKFYSEFVTFNPYLSNSDYRSLRLNFTEYLVEYSFTSEQKEQIWKNYIKLFVLQTKIRNLLVQIKVEFLGEKISYGYEYNHWRAEVTPFYINSFITTFNNQKEGVGIPSSYSKKPTKQLKFKDYGGGVIRADLPYFNNSIPINKNHIDKIKMINKLNQLSYKIIEFNNSFIR